MHYIVTLWFFQHNSNIFSKFGATTESRWTKYRNWAPTEYRKRGSAEDDGHLWNGCSHEATASADPSPGQKANHRPRRGVPKWATSPPLRGGLGLLPARSPESKAQLANGEQLNGLKAWVEFWVSFVILFLWGARAQSRLAGPSVTFYFVLTLTEELFIFVHFLACIGHFLYFFVW